MRWKVFQANRCLLQTQTITHDSILAEEIFQQLNRPRFVQEQRVSALRFADPMVQAVWNALLLFDLLPAGLSNRELRNNLAALLGQPVEQFTQGRMTYQLRRLRLHGLIERIPKTHRYRLTSFGFRVAVFCTRTYSRILRPGLGLALPTTSSFPCSLRRSFDRLEQEVNSWVDHARLAA
jgi:DNA-binding HxlR family transcriptional regulator